MTSRVELRWPADADRRLQADVHRVLHAVVERGGAIGYLAPPTRAETDAWLDEILTLVRAGDASLVLAVAEGRVVATGLWRRGPKPVFGHSAEVQKVMAHPAARGLGLGRTVTEALVDDARKAGIETLTLGVRGNNHGAIELYERLGFREWGRLPNFIAVGDERYDDVRMSLDLGRAPNVVLRGSPADGPGSSPRRG
ncbi:L-amino acid N-acyltransferase YncA [Micromonospora pallida]|uniref:L-amino acid N-acyltransferase YncA n=1 Tax=Micromonospora pallida TaxID=145854 RepID=A0A1C6SVY7_9ACTN|nr:GNAT family N-acetyltransferase [Micromonospora pallida]SCL33794.1 L-amino acid N-acyltransferase YncA [Micromonospora pallida]